MNLTKHVGFAVIVLSAFLAILYFFGAVEPATSTWTMPIDTDLPPDICRSCGVVIGAYKLADFSNLFAAAFTLNMGFTLLPFVRQFSEIRFAELFQKQINQLGEPHGSNLVFMEDFKKRANNEWTQTANVTRGTLSGTLTLLMYYAFVASSICLILVAYPAIFPCMHIRAHALWLLCAFLIFGIPVGSIWIAARWIKPYTTACDTAGGILKGMITSEVNTTSK